MKRESFGSRLGFLLVSAGCAIGIGNVWRFPYITGQNGGGYFVLFYLICLVVMGIPVLTMELAVGRAGRKSAVLAYRALEKPGQKWHIHGWFCLLGCCLLMMYYTTVTGWMVSYFGRFAFGSFRGGMATEEVSAVFGQMLSSPMEMGVLAVAVVIVGFLVCSFGLEKGLERVTKVMMLALYAAHPLAQRHQLRREELRGETILYMSPDAAHDSYGDTFFMQRYRDAGYRPNILFRSADTESVLMMVSAEEGISILPDYCVDKLYHADNLIFIPLEGEGEEEEIIAAWQRDNQNPALTQFLSVLNADLDAGRY